MIAHDDATMEEFVRRLSNATIYSSRDTGDVIDDYWRDEAIEWVKELDQNVKT